MTCRIVPAPVRAPTLTSDYYHPEVRDRIYRSQPFTVKAAEVAANAALVWSLGGTMLKARENCWGSWQDAVDHPGQRFHSKWTTDLDASYAFMDHYTLTFGANNLFDTRPSKIAATSANPIYPGNDAALDGSVYAASAARSASMVASTMRGCG